MRAIEQLTDGAVHVWQGTSARETTYADWAMLSSEEHARWRRLRPQAAAHFAGSHAATRRILSRYLSIPPALIQVDPSICGTGEGSSNGRAGVQADGQSLSVRL